MPTDAELLKFSKQIATMTYALYVPTLTLWIGLLARVLISKDRRKLVALIVICTLMILN